MPLSLIYTVASFVTLVLFVVFYFFAVIRRDNGLADVVWGLGAVIASFIAFSLGGFHTSSLQIVVMLMVALWGIRLSGHIYSRNLGKEEDFRYKLMRVHWGSRHIVRSLLEVYVLQWILLMIIVSPVVLILSTPPVDFGVFAIIGFIAWVVGFGFEAISDYQLYVYKLKNASGLYTRGLWKKSRHPNYFGEILMWSGFFLIALEHPMGVFAIVSPVVVTYLLLNVSIPTVEKRMMKKEGYRQYKAKTKALLPF